MNELPNDLAAWRIVRQDTKMLLVSRYGATDTTPPLPIIPPAMLAQARRIQSFALAFDPVTNRKRVTA